MKKIIPYILILAVIVGIFSPMSPAQAQTPTETPGVCSGRDIGGETFSNRSTYAGCVAFVNGGSANSAYWSPDDGSQGKQITKAVADQETEKNQPAKTPDIEGSIGCESLMTASFSSCIQKLVYIIFVTLPSALMALAAKMFNFLATLTLSSKMYGADFIGKIWRVVRDFANIFFILILLYAAFQIILDLGHGGAKKIVASVILIALLVNFSLFFTKIVIDSSNIVALIFYNRIDTSGVSSYTQVGDGTSGVVEKDLAGALVSAFNINAFFTPELVGKLQDNEKKIIQDYCKSVTILHPIDYADCHLFTGNPSTNLDSSVSIPVFVAYGLVVFAVTYAFLVVALSFLGRMITLMMLMILSPLAFVTAAVPSFKHTNTIGFDSWIKKLLESSFMAAVFMFILYVVAQILQAKIFGDSKGNTGFFETLILLFVPAILIVVFLLKGASYAKKASGEFTEKIMGGAKVVGGFALGAGAGLAAAGGTKLIGGGMKRIANNDELRAKAAAGDKGAQRRLDRANYWMGKSFDLRQTGVGKFASSKTGLNLAAGTGVIGLGEDKFKGGIKAIDKHKLEAQRERFETYEMTPSEAREQNEKAKKWNEKYEEHKKFAKDDARRKGIKFDEKEFKEDYIKGESLAKYGFLGGEKGGEKEKNAEGINEERREAYAWSLANPRKIRDMDEKRIKETFKDQGWKGFGSSFRSGLSREALVGAGVGSVAGLMGAAVGAAVGASLGGLAAAIKDLTKSRTDKELVAKLLKEKSATEKVSDAIKGALQTDSHAVENAAHKLEHAAHETEKAAEHSSERSHETDHGR